jgi:hypothetical protein
MIFDWLCQCWLRQLKNDFSLALPMLASPAQKRFLIGKANAGFASSKVAVLCEKTSKKQVVSDQKRSQKSFLSWRIQHWQS